MATTIEKSSFMAILELVLGTEAFPVRKLDLINNCQFVQRSSDDLFAATTYRIQSSVRRDVFSDFLGIFQNRPKPSITLENVNELSALAREFCIDDFAAECESFASQHPQVEPEPIDFRLEEQFEVQERAIENLNSRVAGFETAIPSLSRQLSEYTTAVSGQQADLRSHQESQHAFVLSQIAELRDAIQAQAETLQAIVLAEVSGLRAELTYLQSDFRALREETRHLTVPAGVSRRVIQRPMPNPLAMNGIISYLAGIHGTDLYPQTISITSKSVATNHPSDAVTNVVDSTDSHFWSNSESDQWVCWDFYARRIKPVGYAIRTAEESFLKNWKIDTSIDGVTWNVIDEHCEDISLNGRWITKRFPSGNAVIDAAECRFIRLTQTGKNCQASHYLHFCQFEIFGDLIE
jgi:uncharacterized coiled-coil protein SlyX